MREIKFRAYVKDKNKIYDVKEIDFVYKLIRFEEEGKPTDTMRMLDQVELMQYTGLKDSNGKMIFEGDILKDNQGQFGKVFYHNDGARFLVNWLFKGGYYETDSCFGYGEVVGNVYDNPELLKGIR